MDDEALVPESASAECFEAVAAAGDGTEVAGLAEDTEPPWPAFDACASVEESAPPRTACRDPR